MGRVISGVKKARLGFSSYNPRENSRLPAAKAIDDVAKALGVIVPVVDKDEIDYLIHNIRAAFVAGFAAGLGKVCLFYWYDGVASPLDIRDLGHSLRRMEDIDPILNEFCFDIHDKKGNQEKIVSHQLSSLESLTIGDPTAENEFNTLGSYFLKTDEFRRSLRQEINLIVGRKGSGKTALLSQLRDNRRTNRTNIVVDLLPEGYQLVRLKEEVLQRLEEGAALHLISAYWQFIIISEIAYKILEKDSEVHLRDQDLFDPYRKLQRAYYAHDFVGEIGDFSERMRAVSEKISDRFLSLYGNDSTKMNLSSPQVTQLIHEDYLRSLTTEVVQYLKRKDEVWLLFDNLDKGWESYGLSKGDIFILRCLLNASRRVQKQLTQKSIDYCSVLFVRNDVYQMLVREDPDFGKQTRAQLDWSDREQLRKLLIKRLRYGLPNAKKLDEGDLISRVVTPLIGGTDSIDYMIDHSLMRPRNLLKIFSYSKSAAVNSESDRIEKEHIEKGIRIFSEDLLIEASNEIRDITGVEDSLYYFIGENCRESESEISKILENAGMPKEVTIKILEMMLYCGVLGLDNGQSGDVFIFDLNYDMRKMHVLRHKGKKQYVFHKTLSFALDLQ